VCFSRHRYGTQECDQGRLRADELEDRVAESLLSTLARRELLEKAVERWGDIVETNRPDRKTRARRCGDEYCSAVKMPWP
jgi:hypothetical protein